MAINPHIFREFSIRGVADQDLTDDTVQLIGQAAGIFFKNHQQTTLVVGRDVRLSSPRISQALINGLLAAGINVCDVGQVPTPVHNFATDFYGADGGIMITASHNPPPDNGMKMRAEHPLQGSELQEIYQLAINLPAITAEPGTVETVDPLPHYFEAITKLAVPGKPLRVIVDGGNGTNGKIVSKLLQSLGHAVA
ncbi:MAG: phosphomannomutase/phosphoglucomutase, partial [Okeania sp. SIO3B3]|nr:phosphomannomutase/phosphoglucomutase [Okeania sp. SIO3B3]